MDELRDSDEKSKKLEMQWIHYPVEGTFALGISCFHLNYPDKPLCPVYMMKNTTNASSPKCRQIATSTPILNKKEKKKKKKKKKNCEDD